MSDVEKIPHFGRFLKKAIADKGGPVAVSKLIGISDESLRRWARFNRSAEANIRDANQSRLLKILPYKTWEEFIAVADSTPMPVPEETAPQPGGAVVTIEIEGLKPNRILLSPEAVKQLKESAEAAGHDVTQHFIEWMKWRADQAGLEIDDTGPIATIGPRMLTTAADLERSEAASHPHGGEDPHKAQRRKKPGK